MDALREILEKLTNGLQNIYGINLQSVILYGSVARGSHTEESDIDIAILVSEDQDSMHEEMLDLSVDLELECGKVLSVLVIPMDDYEKWNSVSPFYKNVKEEGIILWKAA